MIAILACTFSLGKLARAMNEHGSAEKVQMVRGALKRDLDDVSRAVSTIAAWDVAVAHLYGEPDRAWLRSIIGAGKTSTFVIDRDGRTIVALPAMSLVGGDLRHAIGSALPKVLA
ncbi:hypothetical protein EON77_03510, partial [bacterium]